MKGVKKGTVIILGILFFLFFIIGCGGNNSEPTENEGEKVSKELTVAISSDVMNWERVNFPGGDSRFVWSQIFETLVH